MGADASVPVFKVPLQRNVEEISPEWGLGLLCLPLKKKKKRRSDLLLFSHLQLPICCSFFTTPEEFSSSSASPSTFHLPFVPVHLLECAVGELSSAESLKEDG